MGLIKPVIFGFIIATVGCFYGMNARGGTQGVGRGHYPGHGGGIGSDPRSGFDRHSLADGHSFVPLIVCLRPPYHSTAPG